MHLINEPTELPGQVKEKKKEGGKKITRRVDVENVDLTFMRKKEKNKIK